MTTKKIIKIGILEFQITKHSGQKNLYIRVNPPNGDISVSVPAKTTDRVIKNFVLSKMPEIVKIQDRMKRQFRQTKREYVSGETCYYLGKPYMLQVIYKGRHSEIERVPNKIIMTVPEGASYEKRKKLLIEWYRSELKNILPMILKQCENKMRIKINACNIRNMKTRWGSCNISKRNILINLQLIKKPIECLEYVLIHEFIHLLEKNHTKHFKSLLDKYYPAWKEAKQILKDMPLDYI